jgi:hypothetical protein
MSSINDSCFTYPESKSTTFTKEERARWNKNLEALMKRLGIVPKEQRPRAKEKEYGSVEEP